MALCEQPFQLSETDMEECSPPESYDYFTGSEVSFALTFLAVGLFAVGKNNHLKHEVLVFKCFQLC